MNFFFDNTVAPAYARALHELNKRDRHTVVHLKDKFRRNTDDAVWLRELRREKNGS